MNFKDKLANDTKLEFLKDMGFTKDEKGKYCNGYYSGDKLYYNRVTVWIEGDTVIAENFQEYNVGGEIGTDTEKSSVSENLKETVTDLLNRVLPNDLD